MSNFNVLLIDEEAYCVVLTEIFEEVYGFDVFNAKDTGEAMMYLNSCQVDLILTDVIQPETDGIAFIRHIRSSPAFKAVPIIAVGSRAMADDHFKAKEAGANGFLIKPFGSAELQAAIGPFIPIPKRVKKPQSRKPAA